MDVEILAAPLQYKFVEHPVFPPLTVREGRIVNFMFLISFVSCDKSNSFESRYKIRNETLQLVEE